MKTAVIAYEDRQQIGRGRQLIIDGFPRGAAIGIFPYSSPHEVDKDVGKGIDGASPIFAGFIQQTELIVHHTMQQGKVLFLRIRSGAEYHEHCQDVVLNAGVKVVTVNMKSLPEDM